MSDNVLLAKFDAAINAVSTASRSGTYAQYKRACAQYAKLRLEMQKRGLAI